MKFKLVNLIPYKTFFYSFFVLSFFYFNYVFGQEKGALPIPVTLSGNGPEVIVTPEMGISKVLEIINNAKSKIILGMYRLEESSILEALIRAKQRGVDIQIILNPPTLENSPYDLKMMPHTTEKLLSNQIGIDLLATHGIKVQFPNMNEYCLYHVKFMVVDQSTALISTFNFNRNGFFGARNIGIITHDADVIKTLEYIFQKDWKGEKTVLKEISEKLVLGPEGQRKQLRNIVESSKQAIYIYQPGLNDVPFCNLLAHKASTGVEIKILTSPNLFDENDVGELFQKKIKKHGGLIRFQTKPHIHAKVIIVDPCTENAQMYVGSCNFFPVAIDTSRELGICIKNTQQIRSVLDVFLKDWNKAQKSYRTQTSHSKSLKSMQELNESDIFER